MKKMYKLLSSAKRGFFAIAVGMFSGTAHSQTTYTLSYTGSAQTITIPAGNYSIQCWGADGGSVAANTALPGKGGFSGGSIVLSAPTTFTVYVGGKGNGGAQPLGGFNSGNGTTKTNITTATGGGGASDVRVLADDFYHRIMVAGGGGGQGTSTGTGGHGGGLIGQNGQGTTNAGVGGTQTTPGAYPAGGDAKPAVFGEGSDGPAGTTGGQGGGGWYGGSFGTRTNGGGAGGSGYVLTSTSFTPVGYFSANPSYYFSNAVTYRADEAGFVANPDVTGNGMVLITELCSITLAASNATLSNSTSPVICSGQSLTLTTNAVSNYSWSTGATTSSLVVSPTTTAVYTLTAMSVANCTTSRTISVTVSGGQPTLSVVSSTNQTCLGKTATLTASGALTYTWSNGVSNGVSFFPSTTTTYTVTGQNGCGTVTAVSTISVSPLTVTAATSASAVCTNQTATLSVTAAANSYTWNPGNITGTSPNLIVNPQANTNYTIAVSDGTCSGVGTVSVQVNPVPTISASASSSIVCPGGTVGLSATGGINYTWTPVNLNGASITVSPQASAVYNVTGDNSFGCLNNASQVVVVGAQPTVVLSTNSPSICGGGSATLTASGADTYAWTGGPTTTVYVVSPTTNTTYTVTGTNSSSGCTDTKNIDISVFVPSIAVTGNTAVCDGEQVNLSASGGSTYTWNPGSLQFPSIQVVPLANTIFTVDALATQGVLNCPGSATFQVIVNPNPTVTTSSVKPAICAKETNTYSASGASTYTWTSNAGTVVGPTVTVTSSVTALLAYTVAGTNAQGCVGESNFVVTINSCLGLDQSTKADGHLLVYPNPNNGDFTVNASSEMSVRLINALGQQLREFFLNADNGYRATVSDLPQGVYFVLSPNAKQKVIINR